jgi:hypothetical protein
VTKLRTDRIVILAPPLQRFRQCFGQRFGASNKALQAQASGADLLQ